MFADVQFGDINWLVLDFFKLHLLKDRYFRLQT